MLDSIPIPFQATLWPLLGAALTLTLSRLLPTWLRRLIAAAAAAMSLATLWPLKAGTIAEAAVFWEPVNLFRMSPMLRPDSLSVLAGVVLAFVAATTILSVRGSEPRRTTWHGLILIALAGGLVTTMATNLLALALGSALLDLALIALTASAPQNASRSAWRMAAPGAVSTIVLVLAALQMDAEVGTASLLAKSVPTETLVLVSVGGLLRLMVFPVHPRGLYTPQNAATSLMAAATGIYLLARVQAIGPTTVDQAWMQVIGTAALVAGGLLAWAGPSISPRTGAGPDESAEQTGSSEWKVAETWHGMAIQQAGYAVVFVILVESTAPWPLISMTLALGLLTIWWDGTLDRIAVTKPWMVQRFQLPERWQTSQALSLIREHLNRYALVIFPILALASLAGVPLSAGAIGRWALYGTLLYRQMGTQLIAIMIADTFLAAALWATAGATLKQARKRRPGLSALVAMGGLAIALIGLGIAPGALNPAAVETPDVSVWALALVYVLPWALGGWLARVGVRLRDLTGAVRAIVELGWLYRAASWIGQRLAGGLFWFGQVGEGEGWWGWALIILALGTTLLTTR